VFIGIYIKDARLCLGSDYFKDPLYARRIAFDIVSEEELKKAASGKKINLSVISCEQPNNKPLVPQPPYNHGTTQVEVFLKVGVDYYIVPSLSHRGQNGTFFLNVYANVTSFFLEGSTTLVEAQMPMVIGGKKEDGKGGEAKEGKELKMSVSQFYQKKEILRERMVKDIARLSLNTEHLKSIFKTPSSFSASSVGKKEINKLSLSIFKKKMMELGFQLADFPDDDLVVLDADNDGTIDPEEFLSFITEGQRFLATSSTGSGSVVPVIGEAPIPEKPVDDLLYKAIDFSGELNLQIFNARSVREPGSWLNSNSNSSTSKVDNSKDANSNAPPSSSGDFLLRRGLIKYSLEDANAVRNRSAIERYKELSAVASKQQLPLNPAPKDVPSQKATVSELEAANPELEVGVEANYRGKGRYFPGKISRNHGNGTYDINYDDGEIEVKVKADLIKVSNPSVPIRPTSAGGNLSSLAAPPLTAASLRGAGSSQFGGDSHHHTSIHRPTANSVISEISQSQKEAVKQAGAAAGAKLHSDVSLMKAEQSRTKHLSDLRSFNKKMSNDSDSVNKTISEHSVLRRKGLTSSKVKSRDFSQDLDAQIFLNYFPSALVGLSSNNNSKNGSSSSSNDEVFHHMTGYYDEIPGSEGVDLWDYLIDCVITIVDSRAKTSSSSLQYSSYLQMKKERKVTSLTLSELSPQPSIASSIPTPALSKSANPNKLTKGHTPTPKGGRKVPGTASVTTAQTKQQQRNNMIEVKDRLNSLASEQGTVYHEVFRRLLAIPTIDQSDLLGEKSSASVSSSSLGDSSSSKLLSSTITSNLNQIYLLFLKFDKNYNGFISKEEFQLVFKELKITISKDECDIFFNRFSSSKSPLNGIDWKEFLSFFQSRLLLESSSSADSLANDLVFSNERNNTMNRIINLLLKIKYVFEDILTTMMEEKIFSIDKLLMDKAHSSAASSSPSLLNGAPKTPSSALKRSATAATKAALLGGKDGSKLVSIPSNAIFQSLNDAQIKYNLAILKSFGLLYITVNDMMRINRIFNYDLNLFMEFMKNDQILSAFPSSSTVSVPLKAEAKDTTIASAATVASVPSLHELVNYCDLIIAKELSLRIGYPVIRPVIEPKEPKTTTNSSSSVAASVNEKKDFKAAAVKESESDAKDAKADLKPSVVSTDSKKVSSQPSLTRSGTIPPASTVPVTMANFGFKSVPLSDLRQDLPNPTVKHPLSSFEGYNGTSKVWNCLTNQKNSSVSFDSLLTYFQELLSHSHILLPSSPASTTVSSVSSSLPLATAEKKEGSKFDEKSLNETTLLSSSMLQGEKKEETNKLTTTQAKSTNHLFGIPFSILIGLVIDSVIYSDWNRVSPSSSLSASSSTALNYLSISGLDAYIRYSHIQLIEKKLKYLLLLEKNFNSPFTYLLLHVCINPVNNELIIIANDPISNDIYKLQCKEEVILTASNAASLSQSKGGKGGNAGAGGGGSGPMIDLPVGDKIKQSIIDYYTASYNYGVSSKQPLVWNKSYVLDVGAGGRGGGLFLSDAFYLYNPVELPSEDRVMADLLSRLKLVRRPVIHNQPFELILGENPLLIKQMKDILDYHSEKLPFFYIANDLYLRYEIDIEQLRAAKKKEKEREAASTSSSSLIGSAPSAIVKKPLISSSLVPDSEVDDGEINIRHLIFNAIRNLKNLHSFFTSLKSSLTIILSTYNSTVREVISWDEYLLHLLNYRNCFLTVRLFPKFIATSKYLYESPDQLDRQNEKSGKEITMSSTRERNNNPDFREDEENLDGDDLEEQEAEEAIEDGELVEYDKKKYKNFYISKIDYDGLPYPSFNQLFSFFYQQSKISSCSIVTTEVIKMKIDEVKKYVMVVVREGKRRKLVFPDDNTTIGGGGGGGGTTNKGKTLDVGSFPLTSSKKEEKEKFWFLTLYDPRSATEYQCGIQEKSALYQQFYYHKLVKSRKELEKLDVFSIDLLRRNLHEASELSQLIVGDATTPRLEFQLFNYKDHKCQELIGECQISISSVLSNSGVGDRLWSTLVYKVDKEIPSSSSSGMMGGPDKKKTITLPAGELEIELSFRRSLEMESDQFLLNPKKLKAISAATLAKKGSTVLPSTPRFDVHGPGDQTIAPAPLPSASVAVMKDDKTAKVLKDLANQINALQKENTQLKSSSTVVAATSSPRKEVASAAYSSDEVEKLTQALKETSQSVKTLETRCESLEDELKRTKKEKKQLTTELNEKSSSAVLQSKGPSESDYGKLVEKNSLLSEEIKSLRSAVASSSLPPQSSDDFLLIPSSPADLSTSADFDVLPIIHQILQFLYRKHEKKLIVDLSRGVLPSELEDGSNGKAGSDFYASVASSLHITAVAVLKNLGKLLQAYEKNDYVSYQQIKEVFLEYSIYLDSEMAMKIINFILGNYGNVMSNAINRRRQNEIIYSDFLKFLENELNRLMKDSHLGSYAIMEEGKRKEKKNKVRNSLELVTIKDKEVANETKTRTLASADDQNVKRAFEKGNNNTRNATSEEKKKVRPASANPPVVTVPAAKPSINKEKTYPPSAGDNSVSPSRAAKQAKPSAATMREETTKEREERLAAPPRELPEGWDYTLFETNNRVSYSRSLITLVSYLKSF
jgi:Ca2+-binding EF-hand superfamily protein